ncbi:MAG: glutathione S-transferase family protein [Alcaligenaceae bacterium]|nr:glutathione S-transferase family protein [Alcaligenaceae bacterium]
MLKLYDYELSGNCYKARLLLSILGLEHELVPVEFFPAKEHRKSSFLAVNPLGQLPVLDDNGFVVRDSQAILVYLACKYDESGKWYPLDDAVRLAQMQMWLSFANEITATASVARQVELFQYDMDAVTARKKARELFTVIDEHLWFAEKAGQQWLCSGEHPTIADLACFPYIMLSDEADISLIDYPAIRRWTDRVKAIPGFSTMSGIFSAASN